jgi:hypothetical protein
VRSATSPIVQRGLGVWWVDGRRRVHAGLGTHADRLDLTLPPSCNEATLILSPPGSGCRSANPVILSLAAPIMNNFTGALDVGWRGLHGSQGYY